MHFIKSLIKGSPNDVAHQKFTKFGIGDFPGPQLVVKKSSKRITLISDIDYDDMIFRIFVNALPDDTQEYEVKGNIVVYAYYSKERSKFDDTVFNISWKNKKLTYVGQVKQVVKKNDLVALANIEFPGLYYMLTIKPKPALSPWSLTTKTRFPKLDKPDEVEEGAKEKLPTYCKAVLAYSDETLDAILDEALPELKDSINRKFKILKIKNRFVVEELIFPPNKDKIPPAELRRKTKRKGKIIQTIVVDSESITKEYNFEA